MLARDVGSVVYFARLPDDLVKIGYSAHIGTRLRNLGGFDALLALMPGDRHAERAEHERFVSALARDRECFHPTPAIFDRIDQIRASYGLQPCTRWE